MLRIGLTGGIGSGKSTVAKVFEVLGIPVYYADDEAKRLMNEDETLKQQVIRHFGEKSYTDNKLNRSYIASIVFNNNEKLALLNSLTHPVTIRHADEWMKQQTAPYIIKEAALLFESGANEHLDKIIGVDAPQSLRIERVMLRDKVSKEDVMKRINRQMDDEEKMKRCDFVIKNDEQELLLPQVMKLHEDLLSLAKQLK
jgi:dephospho-CoA kinase